MRISTSMRWLVVAVSAAMLLAFAAACSAETIEVPGETVVIEKVVIKEVQVPGETVVVEKEVIKTVEVPGETVTKEVIKEVMVPGETVVVTKEVPVQVTKTVEIPGPERVMVKEVPGKKYVTDPVTGSVFTAPEYGGTITFAKQNDYNQRGVDLYARGNRGMTSPVIEKLSAANWALDRSLYSFNTGYVTPVFALTGALAESWELTDDRTFVFKVRQGAKWHNRAPMNGRDVTAGDFAFTYHRWLGNKLAGTEFSEADPSPVAGSLGAFPWDSIVATDDSTLVMKMTEPAPYIALQYILDSNLFGIQAPEIIREKGGIKDWRDLIGTGPFEMTEWIFGENFTYEKNPDYWAMDHKYPENPVPYIDTLRGLVIVEGATRLAGLRSGTLDYMGHPGSSQIQSIDQALSLARTNPELAMHEWQERSNNSFNLNKSRPPFDNIDVRRAMQMALDLDTMTASYFSGYADTLPRGQLDTQWAKLGYVVPYEEWPEELKGYYTYNPEAAEALLDDAGYERGDDGYRFEVEFSHFNRWPVAWSEFAVTYWDAIGIKIDLVTPAAAEHNAKIRAHDFDIVPTAMSNRADPLIQMWRFYAGSPWNPTIGHPDYDAWWEAAQLATTEDETKELVKKMDYKVIEESWLIWGSLSPVFNVAQPWIMGYNGEGVLGGSMNHAVFQYLWVDSELKTGMGH